LHIIEEEGNTSKVGREELGKGTSKPLKQYLSPTEVKRGKIEKVCLEAKSNWSTLPL